MKNTEDLSVGTGLPPKHMLMPDNSSPLTGQMM